MLLVTDLQRLVGETSVTCVARGDSAGPNLIKNTALLLSPLLGEEHHLLLLAAVTSGHGVLLGLRSSFCPQIIWSQVMRLHKLL